MKNTLWEHTNMTVDPLQVRVWETVTTNWQVTGPDKFIFKFPASDLLLGRRIANVFCTIPAMNTSQLVGKSKRGGSMEVTILMSDSVGGNELLRMPMGELRNHEYRYFRIFAMTFSHFWVSLMLIETSKALYLWPKLHLQYIKVMHTIDNEFPLLLKA